MKCKTRACLKNVPDGGLVLVTGAAGFAGRYLIDELTDAGYRVCTTDVLEGLDDQLPGYRAVDLRNRDAVVSLLRKLQPDACIHLGAVSFVPDGDRDPSSLLTINIGGTVNILEAIRQASPDTLLLFVSTSQVYGAATRCDAEAEPVKEDSPCRPVSLYAISKAACEQAVAGYAVSFGIRAIVARPANHTGPGQSPRFVTAAFAQQVREAAVKKNGNEIRVGNLDSVRDFTDVRDVVRAYRLLLEKGEPGRTYNISAGQHFRIGRMLELLQILAGTDLAIRQDPELLRPADRGLKLDVSSLQDATGWKPLYEFRQTLNDMLESVTPTQ